MGASEAYDLAREYASAHMHWYDSHATLQLYLYRGFGVLALVSGVLVTFLAAATESGWKAVGPVKMKHVVAGLGLVVTLSAALSGFYGWQENWASYRKAHLQIEYLLRSAEITRAGLTTPDENDELRDLARGLMEDVRHVIEEETGAFFDRLKPVAEPPGDKS